MQGFVSTQGKKIPLIFRKWSLLRKYLNKVAIENFKFVLSTEREVSNFSQDVTRDYNLVKDLSPMHTLNNLATESLLNAGTRVLKELMDDVGTNNSNLSKTFDMKIYSKKDIKKVISSWKRFIKFRRTFIDIAVSVDSLFKQVKQMNEKSNVAFSHQGSVSDEDTYSNLSLVTLEKAFEAEVTLVYYLTVLETSHNISLVKDQLQEPWEIEDGQIVLRVENPRIALNPFSPRVRLKEIMVEDDEVADYLGQFMTEVFDFRERELIEIKRMSESVGLIPN
jgi:hypothetical protein